MYCSNCGSNLPDDIAYCTQCGTPTNRNNANYQNYPQYRQSAPPSVSPDDKPGFGWGLLGFIIPIIGFIMYFVWRDEYPQRAKSLLKGAIIQIIVCIIFTILSVVMFVALFIFGSTSTATPGDLLPDGIKVSARALEPLGTSVREVALNKWIR